MGMREKQKKKNLLKYIQWAEYYVFLEISFLAIPVLTHRPKNGLKRKIWSKIWFFPKSLNDGKWLTHVTNLFEIDHFRIY